MAKRKIDDDFDDDFEDDFEDETIETEVEIKTEDDSQSEEECADGHISINDDDDAKLDILIEIDEEDLNLLEDQSEGEKKEEDSEDDIVLSKHKVEGKHSLKYDSIFKGKKDDPIEEDGPDSFVLYHKETIEVDKSSNYYI